MNLDYTNHLGLEICHKLGKASYLPIRGWGRIIKLLANVVPKPTPNGLCKVKTVHGFSILVDPVKDKGLERELFNFGTYEEGTLRVMKHLLDNCDTFVDVGANIGLMSLHAAKILSDRGSVLSFEPLQSTFSILKKNIEINGFENIEAINIAIGSEGGSLNIYENLCSSRGSSSLIKPDQEELSHKISVMRLDEYISNNESKYSIGCIKVDVEGWELEVLKGAHGLLSSRKAPICIVECSSLHPMHGGGVKEIYTFLRGINSYRIFCLERGKAIPSRLVEIENKSDLPKHDNLFCLLPDHIKKLSSRIFK